MEKSFAGIDSLVTFTNTSLQTGRGTLIHISRSVAVFEVYNPYSIIQLSEVLQELVVMRGERVIYRGKGVVTSIVATGLMIIASVTLTDSWMSLAHLQPGPALSGEAERFIEGWEQGLQISDSYQLAVNKFSNFMAEISRWIEEAETAIIGKVPEGEDKHGIFRASIERPVAGKLGEMMRLFESESAQIPEEDASVHKAFARRELHPYILCAPFAFRSFMKPLGYAGDYEMVNMMLKESDSTGNNTYARIFHDLTTDVAAAAAHRNRVRILEEQLVAEAERVQDEQRIFTVLSIGCGPAVEIQRFIRNHEVSAQAVIHLMDFNEETIEYAKLRAGLASEVSGHKPTMKFIQKSIDELLKDIHQEQEGFLPVYDMIYCAGLFDYFPDNVCRNLVHLYHGWVRPGGLLVTTNVHPVNPDRFTMEYLFDWYLIYRNEKQMAALAPKDVEAEVFADKTGVNVFMNIRKAP
jgi:extracellular factor (EF) 3-hydroxypalmitic acid methyl ester biosynthesis protein